MKLLSLITVLMLGAVAFTLAQTPLPTPPAASVPLDGLSTLLVAAGVGYGAKKLREKRNDKPEL
ncbi:PID-CTERM protein-sorting domain-containing protein [Bacteroidota bacterium]